MWLSGLIYSHLTSGQTGLGIGLFGIWQVQGYPMGRPRQMGPGFFPFSPWVLMEKPLRCGLPIGRGDPMLFHSRPISAAFLALAAVLLLWMIFDSWRPARKVTQA